MIYVKRTFHPIGQGAFFTEQFFDNSQDKLLYNVVYMMFLLSKKKDAIRFQEVTCASGSLISMMTVLSIGLLIHGCQAMPSWTIRLSTIFWRRLLLMKMSWIRRMLTLWFS